MALMDNGYKRIDGSRSNTALVKSGHASPAEEWMLDRRFTSIAKLKTIWKDGSLFTYLYGGPGMQEVTIPKGRVVGVSTPQKDFVTKKYKTVLTLPGLALNCNTIGMVPYNITKDWLQEDRLGGNKPSVITMEYVILPYIPSMEPEVPAGDTLEARVEAIYQEEYKLSVQNKMPWGAILGKLEVGDYVKATPSGRLTKWIKGTDDFSEVVGQALACDLNAEEWGWMKWMLWDESALSQDDKYINRSGASNLPSDNGYPYDPAFSEGNTVFQDIQGKALTDPTGIEGLHDGSGNFIGYGRNDTQYTDMEIGEIPDGTAADVLIQLQAVDFAGGKLTNLRAPGDSDNFFSVKVGDTEITPEAVNWKKGIITIKTTAGMAGKKVTANYKALHFGTSSYLDFKGVAGAFFILLKK